MKRWADIFIKLLTVAVAVIVALLPYHAFISTWGGTMFGPLLVWKSWKEVLLVALVVPVIGYIIARPDVAKTLARRWVNWLILLFFVINGLWAVFSPASNEAVIAGLLFNLRFFVIFLVAQLIVASAHPLSHKLRQFMGPLLLTMTVVVSIIAIVQVAFLPSDFLSRFGYGPDTIAPFILLDDTQNALRAFATLRGPNELGSYLLVPLALSAVLVFVDRRNVLAGLSLGLAIVALALTGSRSAWLGAITTVIALLFLWVPWPKLKQWFKWGVLPVMVGAGLFLWLAATIPALRLAVFHSSSTDTSLFEGSTEKHWQATDAGLRDALAHPFGQGVGTAGPASFYNQNDNPKIAESYYVQLAQEIGFAGLALFISICGVTLFDLWRQRKDLWAKVLLASFAGLTVVNVVLHGWVDDPTAITWWALAGLHVFAKKAQP